MTKKSGPGKGKRRVMSRLLARFRRAALGIHPKRSSPAKKRRPRRRPLLRRKIQPGIRRNR